MSSSEMKCACLHKVSNFFITFEDCISSFVNNICLVNGNIGKCFNYVCCIMTVRSFQPMIKNHPPNNVITVIFFASRFIHTVRFILIVTAIPLIAASGCTGLRAHSHCAIWDCHLFLLTVDCIGAGDVVTVT